MRLINADEKECWACQHHATGKCDTWCDHGEAFELREDVKNAKTFCGDKIDFTFIASDCGDWEGLYANGKLIAEGHSVRAIDVLDAIADILPNRVERICVSEDVAVMLPKYLKDLNK